MRSFKKWLPVIFVLGLPRDSFQRDVIVPVGGNLTLSCPSDFDTDTHWYKEDNLIRQISPRIRVMKQTLQLTYVEPGDSGNYACSFNTEDSVEWRNFTIFLEKMQNDAYDNRTGKSDGLGPDEETNKLQVESPNFPEMSPLNHNETAPSSPPVFKKTDSMQSLIMKPAGNTLRIRCPSTGNPPPNITWLKNDEEPKRVHGSVIISKWGLRIEDLEVNDSGNYTCVVCNHVACINHTSKVEVIERFPHKPYINEGFPKNVTTVVNSMATFKCPIVSDLEPYITWVKLADNPWDKEGSPNATLIQANAENSEVLTIHNVTKEDQGWYTCIAQNIIGESFGSAYLEVEEPRSIPRLKGLEAFYLPKQKVGVYCNILGIPALNVSWTFLKAPNYPSLNGSEMIKLKNYSTVLPISMTDTVVSFTIEMSGLLTCTACNSFRCDSATDVVLVSDVPGGFGIMETDMQLTKGDDVQVTCAASLYNYTGVEWLNNMDEVIVETDRISIAKSSTNFTHRSTLQIKNVQESDNASYYLCSAMKDHYASTDRSMYQIVIHDATAPIISDTNMNKSTITIDLRSDGHKSRVFTCYVRGLPKPNVTWYKDDTRIRSNEQYECRFSNQELEIKYFNEESSGKYTCKVENRLGGDENYQIISIKVKEDFTVLIISIVGLVLICVIFVIYFSIMRHREKVMRKQLIMAGLMHFEEGAVQRLNRMKTIDDQADLLPYDKKWEFPRERLKLGKELGFGAFGVVTMAQALGICKDEAVSTVAVKMVRKSTACTYIRILASELKIMVHLGKHLNVVNLLGACTKNIIKHELLVIVEYCPFGNLHDYLLRHRTDFINQIDPVTRKLDSSNRVDVLKRKTSVESNRSDRSDEEDQNNKHLKFVCTQDLLSWAFQVARGMEYLNLRKVLHGDLAARNILLAENNIVKISDFGLARTMYKDDNYKKQGGVPLPIKWMAIESIRDRIFSTQSDVWSFGIVLWEFFTLAKTPYPTMGPERQYARLMEGYRMEQPEYATNEVYDLMLLCWRENPSSRPTFTFLVSCIGSLLEECVKNYYMDLNIPYMNINSEVFENAKNDYLTMMSAPDYDAAVSPCYEHVDSSSLSSAILHDYCQIPLNAEKPDEDSGIFSARITSNCYEMNSPTSDGKSNVHSDSESKADELSPMLNPEDNNYQETTKCAKTTTEIRCTETSHEKLR